ncbi:Nup93/Nic96-domain-containing protein [Scheffersomyces xylosifermentans]|uniref:Nup93/Nic96-domain-containing protein n=1 Tax=Scheffersomyces xylosifermentans TaxID=1304137 RepID=UPI00315C78EC
MSLFGQNNQPNSGSGPFGSSSASNNPGQQQSSTLGSSSFGGNSLLGGQQQSLFGTHASSIGGQSQTNGFSGLGKNTNLNSGSSNFGAVGNGSGASLGANVSSASNISNINNTSSLPSSLNQSSSKLIKDLLESAHNLPKSDNLELGSVHLTLKELQRKSQKLRKTEDSSKKDANFTKAHYLLASSGISAEEIESELNSIHLPANAATGGAGITGSSSLAAVGSTVNTTSYSNIENYLNAKKDENILNTIEQSLNLASKDFDQFISSNISIDWKVRRDELRKSIGLRSGTDNTSDILRSSITWNKSVPGAYNILTPLRSQTSSTSSLKQLPRDKFENHAKIIYQLNEARLENRNFPLSLNFAELNKLQNDLKSRQITEVWKILIELTNEKFTKTNQEQKFYNQPASKLSTINSSKSYLESEFFKYMEELYLKDNKKGPEFLPPSNLNKISYFIDKVILKNDSDLLSKTLSVNGTPIWALIFYLLRSGLYDDALDLVTRNQDLFNKFDMNFPIYLRKYVASEDHILPSGLNEKLHAEFNQQFQFIVDDIDSAINFDPYKYSVYKIVGKCDLSKKSLPQAINLSIEDWLWFHLSIINEHQWNNESNLIFENYSLVNLQNKIMSLGPKYFNTSSNNPMYLKTLILVGLYELAVQYSYDFINECDAVHLAIGLNYYGFLKVSSYNNKDELLIVRSNEYEINFSRLLGSYTRSFKISDPKVACQYLILIAMSNGGNSKEEISKCHEALRELILISREFSMLLGEMNQMNGSKIPGILERQRSLIKLDDLQEFYSQIIERSAIKCEDEGRIFDALLLYQLCQEFDTVISLINKLLAEILSSTELDKPIIQYGNYEVLSGGSVDSKGSQDTIDNNVILFARHIVKIFNINSFILEKIDPQKKETCDLLLPIIDIRDLFIRKDFHQVLIEIKKLGLIPLGSDDNLISIRKASELIQNNHLDDNLIKVIPSLLIMVMTSISQLNFSILTKRYQALGNEREELADLKKRAKNCMIYAGMVQYKMPRETYSLLINLESSL